MEDIKQRDKNINEEDVRKNYRADAMFNIKWFHLKEKIAADENLKATDEDFKTFNQFFTRELKTARNQQTGRVLQR